MQAGYKEAIIILYSPKKKEQSPSSEVIITPELFNSKTVPENFKGAIIKYDLNNNKVLSKHYEGGVLTGKDDNLVVRKKAKTRCRLKIQHLYPKDAAILRLTGTGKPGLMVFGL